MLILTLKIKISLFIFQLPTKKNKKKMILFVYFKLTHLFAVYKRTKSFS